MVTLVDMLLVATESAERVLEGLDPPRRAVVIMALLGLVLTGLLLVTIAMLGAHWARRLARHRPGAYHSAMHPATHQKSHQLRESLRPILPDANSAETIELNCKAKDTKADH